MARRLCGEDNYPAALLAVAGYGLPGGSRAFAVVPLPDGEWESLLVAARAHRVLGQLRAAVDAGVPPVTDVLGDVECRVLKGSAYAHLDYPEPALRSFVDRRRNNRDRFDDMLCVRVGSEARVLPARVGAPLGVTAVLATVALVVMGFLYAGQSVGAAVDAGIRDELREVGSPWRQLALVVDWLAEPVGAVVVLATLLIILLRAGNRRGAMLAVAAPAVAVALTTGMKPLVGRTINDGFLSFPSGHTAFLTTCAFVAMLVVARAGLLVLTVVTVAAAVAMAWAQVLLNAHYPTDTLGGFCAALAVVPAVAWVSDRVPGGTPVP